MNILVAISLTTEIKKVRIIASDEIYKPSVLNINRPDLEIAETMTILCIDVFMCYVMH